MGGPDGAAPVGRVRLGHLVGAGQVERTVPGTCPRSGVGEPFAEPQDDSCNSRDLRHSRPWTLRKFTLALPLSRRHRP